MREFQDKRRFKKFFHSRYAIAILLIVCALLARATWGVYQKYEKSKDIANRMKNDLSAVQARESSLNQSIKDLNTNEGKERVLRSRFGVVKEDERLIVLVDDKASNSQPITPLELSWWGKFASFFGF